jgi:hypothetical protein
MTKSTKQKSRKKNLLIALGVLLSVAVTLFILEITDTTHFFHTSQQEKDKQQAALIDAKKKKTFTQTTSSSGKGESSNTTYTPPNNPDNIIIDAKQESANQAVITTKLYGYSDGTCSLNIQNDGHTYTANAQVIYQAEYSSCAGFSVPTNTLYTGTWNISLSVTSGGITQTKATTLEVK